MVGGAFAVRRVHVWRIFGLVSGPYSPDDVREVRTSVDIARHEHDSLTHRKSQPALLRLLRLRVLVCGVENSVQAGKWRRDARLGVAKCKELLDCRRQMLDHRNTSVQYTECSNEVGDEENEL